MSNKTTNKSPLAEVFGFPISNDSTKATRYRSQKLCPFNNKVPNCTKDKANNPLGVCSINHGNTSVITCPIRFREEWIIIENAANALELVDTVYTEFEPALFRITTPEPGNVSDFINILQSKLDEHLDKNPPDAPSLTDIIRS